MIFIGRAMIVVAGIAVFINIGLYAARLPTDSLVIYLVGMGAVGAFVAGIIWHARSRL